MSPSLPTKAALALPLGLVVLVTLLGLALFTPGDVTAVGLLYLLPVLVAATRSGLRPGIITGLVAALACNFFFVPPTHTLLIESPRNFATVLVLLGVAIAGSRIAAGVRAQALAAQASADHNSTLARFARQLTGTATLETLGEVLCTEVARVFGCRTVLVVADGGALVVTPATPLETLDDAAARWSCLHGEPAGRGTTALTASEWQFHPIRSGDTIHAAFGLAHPDAVAPLREDQQPLLHSLLEQAGLAWQRIALTTQMAALAQVRERDRLRQALLSSVSHDLRTPLTTLLGTLAEIHAATPEQAEHLATANAEAERLHRFLANLLDMVRIEAGALDQRIEPVDLSEAVASAVHDLRSALRDHTLAIALPPDLPLVLVDPRLFHHCLINLIDNAGKYGPPGTAITIAGTLVNGRLALTVSDAGPGIPPGDEARVFETFARIEGSDRKGGTGLGLAIVKGFAEAMSLSVRAANRSAGPGAVFTIQFPADRLKPWDEA